MKILNVRQARNIEDLVVNRLADEVRNANLKNLVLGISGGLDSAIMSLFGLMAIEKNKKKGYSLGYSYKFLNVESDPNDLIKSRVLAHELGFILEEEDLTPWYYACPVRIVDPQDRSERVANGNIKCRLRMIILMREAQLSKGLVLDTDDLSEYWMGFWTLHGDVGNIKVIQSLTKNELRDLGEYLGIPRIILDSPPGDGLGVTTTNQASDQLGMEYLKIDYVVSRLMFEGFNCNGDKSQLELNKYKRIFSVIAKEISEPEEKVLQVAKQTVATAFKRINGDGVKNLLPDRKELGLSEMGKGDFNSLYLRAIRKQI